MHIPLRKNWKNPTKYLVFSFVVLLTACVSNTTNIRPSFDDNYENKFGKSGSNVRPSKRQNTENKTEPTKKESDNFVAEKVQKTDIKGGQYKKAAEKYLGSPYRYGGTTKRGFDCSGFVWRVYQDVGHTNFSREPSQAMFNRGKTVSQNSVREGDLVFFYVPRSRKKIDHVGIYIDNGNFIHSSSSKGIMYSKLTDYHWKDNLAGFKRLLP